MSRFTKLLTEHRAERAKIDPLLDLKEVALTCAVDVSTVRRWLTLGMLPYWQVAKFSRIRVRKSVLDNFMAQHERQAANG
jgi:predicted site-specific integrase-resolvase